MITISNNEVEITLQRNEDNGKTTIGTIGIGAFEIRSLEDTGRDYNHDGDFDDPGEGKVYGKTRILCGRHEIKLRDEGTMNESYKDRFVFHRGMLYIEDTPHFKFIYIHIGNHADNSLGCIMTGSRRVNGDWVDDSEKAYCALYGYKCCLFDMGFKVFLNILDEK